MQARRPRPGEDDLEEMEEEWRAGRAQAAVTRENVVNKRPKAQAKGAGGASIFAQKRQKKEEENRKRFQLPEREVKEEEEEPMLRDIVERNMERVVVRAPAVPAAQARPFPAVTAVASTAARADKRSLFAAQFEQMKAGLGGEGREGRRVDLGQLGQASRLLSGEGESKEVHAENLERLKEVTEEEVLEEQRRLLASMDPAMVAWIRARKAGTKEETGRAAEKTSETVECSDDSTGAVGPAEGEVLRSYPGMEVEEGEKLAWTGDLPPLPASSPLASLAARFGLDGSLLPADLEVPVQVPPIYRPMCPLDSLMVKVATKVYLKGFKTKKWYLCLGIFKLENMLNNVFSVIFHLSMAKKAKFRNIGLYAFG